jgi:UDP-N-acetylglucosamine 2-epimerase (non-hydrolysing)
LRLLCIVGARPNFMKIAPLMRVFRERPEVFDARLVHTGQHYDEAMKDAFFRQLRIPEPDIDLGVGSGSHAVQTAEIMRRFEPVVDELAPDLVLVVGDVNSTIACALVASKKGIGVVHVEAGLRSWDRRMPEEINRVLTDQISDLLFTTEPDGATNLLREGVAAERIHFVGNVMIDTLFANRQHAVPADQTLARIPDFPAAAEGFGVLTLHRPSNVDDPVVLTRLLDTLADLSQRMPLVFPIHPRTRARLAEAGLAERLADSRIALTEPLPYLDLLGLMLSARLVLTDSGGLQEETTALGVPCITLRENTERPITVEQGTNTVVGTDPAAIRASFEEVLGGGGKAGRSPELWDGRAAERIAAVLAGWNAVRG